MAVSLLNDRFREVRAWQWPTSGGRVLVKELELRSRSVKAGNTTTAAAAADEDEVVSVFAVMAARSELASLLS